MGVWSSNGRLVSRLRCAAWLMIALINASCSTAATTVQSPNTARGYPTTLIDPLKITNALGGDFVTRQVISGAYGRKDFRFEAVLQKRQGEITVVGLTPMGTRAFVLRQRGLDVTFEQSFPGRSPFPARYILNDIHRAFFWHAWQAFGTADPPPDGERQMAWQGENVAERWRQGRLIERRFERKHDGFCSELVVRYDGGWRGCEEPPQNELDNAWFGYRLRIESVDFRRL